MNVKVQFFKDKDGGNRFRVRAANGEILATSEGYTRPRDAKRGWVDLTNAVSHASAISTEELVFELSDRLREGTAIVTVVDT